MKKLYGLTVFALLLAPALFAQEHYTEGPVWRVQLIRVKPTHMDDYLTSLRKSTKPLIEEQKKEGIITDYKVFLKETKNNPEDWDICVAIQLESWVRNSDNRVRLAVVVQRHANSMRIRTITLLPQACADDGDGSRAELILLSLERAASY